MGGSWFEASLSKKLARFHFNKSQIHRRLREEDWSPRSVRAKLTGPHLKSKRKQKGLGWKKSDW
jgi:hypothetical protein